MSSESIQFIPKKRVSHLPKDPMNKIAQNEPRLAKAKSVQVSIEGNKFVAQASDGVSIYHGDFVENICECPDNKFRGLVCKHILAAKLLNEELSK